MTSALKAQDDPRIFGNDNIFEVYEYAQLAQRNFYKRLMAGQELLVVWINPTDIEGDKPD